MTDTNTSGADVLATLQRYRMAAAPNGEMRLYRDDTGNYLKLSQVESAVAALIEREAAQAARISELEAECAGLKRYWELANAAVSDLQNRIAERDALAAEVKALRVACKPLALMAPHYPAVRTFGNRPRTGEIHTVESPIYGVASIKVEDLWRAHDLLSRASAATGGGNG